MTRAVTRGLKQERQGSGVEALVSQITHVFFLFDFYIIQTLYIPVTIANSDHAVEASMVGRNVSYIYNSVQTLKFYLLIEHSRWLLLQDKLNIRPYGVYFF
jgi:hypothetical protein